MKGSLDLTAARSKAPVRATAGEGGLGGMMSLSQGRAGRIVKKKKKTG